MICPQVFLLGHFPSLPYPGVFEGGRRTLAHAQGQLTYFCHFWTVDLFLTALDSWPVPVSSGQLTFSCKLWTADLFLPALDSLPIPVSSGQFTYYCLLCTIYLFLSAHGSLSISVKRSTILFTVFLQRSFFA